MQSFRLGLIGYPLSQSLSPKIHTAALQSCGLQGDYSLFPIAPDDMQALKALLDCVRSAQLHALNVTIPHKQSVIQFLDDLTPTAQAIGAVNTIYLRKNKLIGDNTDAPGFLTDLNRFLEHSSLITHHSSLVLTAGGSACAVVYTLLTSGWDVTLASRRLEQAQQLASSFNYQLHITDAFLSNIDLSNIALVVNTTPVGMTPQSDQSPGPDNLPLPPHAAVYDLVYNPRETKLVKDALTQGLKAATGLGMLIEQASLSFELWTGHSPSREVMRASVDQISTL